MSRIRFLFIVLALAGSIPVVRECLEQHAVRKILASPNLVEGTLPSHLLSEFHKQPVNLNYAVVLPARPPEGLLIHIPGYGGNHWAAVKNFQSLQSIMEKNPRLSMAHLFVDPSNKFGHSFFVDSQVNGPWATALLEELIPAIEEQFSIPGGAQRRYLIGHSSGGWSALSLLLQFPKEFAGAWATAPDPIDFRSFFGVDITPGSKENFYQDASGKDHLAARGKRQTQREYVDAVIRNNRVANEWVAYEAAWGDLSPLFDRETGALYPETLKKWEAFDLRKKLSENVILRGKIHLRCGEEDTYFLETPTRLFCKALSALNIEATCEIIPGRNHVNLYEPTQQYPQGLLQKMMEEMVERSEEETRESQKENYDVASAAQPPSEYPSSCATQLIESPP